MEDARIVLLGSMEQLVESATALVQHNYRPLRAILPADRDNASTIDSLNKIEVPSIVVDDINADPTPLSELKPDIVLCYAFPQILRRNVIEVASKGTVNFHTSDLPAYRGRHPVNWALIAGEPYIGICAHFVNDRIDDGDIILRDQVAIGRNDDIGSVLTRIREKTQSMTIAVVRQLMSGSAHRERQDPTLATYQRRRRPEDSRVDWTASGAHLHRFINALISPYPNAFAEGKAGRVHFTRSYCGIAAGEVIAHTTDGWHVVGTADGVILVQLDRKLAVGEILG